MTTQHTPEPWSFSIEEVFDNDGVPESVIRGIDGRACVAVAIDFGPNNPGMREANARRIAACVNRLAPFTTEQIEDAGYDLFADQRPRLYETECKLRKVEQQRDELLAACKTTLEENLHLADGDVCTLIAIKKAYEKITGQPLLEDAPKKYPTSKAKEGAR